MFFLLQDLILDSSGELTDELLARLDANRVRRLGQSVVEVKCVVDRRPYIDIRTTPRDHMGQRRLGGAAGGWASGWASGRAGSPLVKVDRATTTARR